jgi:hypothetical protein
LPKGIFGDADATRFSNALKPGGDVDAIAEDIVSLDQHVADVDADAPFHSAFGRGPGIPICRQPLQPQGALDGADHRAELDQHAVSGGLDDPSAMLGDQRFSGAAMLAQCLNRAHLVCPHQP